MDNVNHPAHYNTGKYESIDVMVETQGVNAVKNFCICNAFKYIYRHRFKNGTEDIKKAIWYLNKYVELNELTTDELQTDCDTCRWKHTADDVHCESCGYAGIDNYVPELSVEPIKINSSSRAEVCDRPQMDCSLCWKESHCKAIEEAERKGK